MQDMVAASAGRRPRASLNVRLSKAADDANTSLDGMVADLRDLCRREGFEEIALHIDDGISGAVRDRPGFVAWLDDAREGRADVLVAWHVDRMTREGLNVAALILDVQEGKDPATGQRVREPVRLMDTRGLDSNDGDSFRIRFVLQAEMARSERQRMIDRSRRRVARLREAGRWGGGTPPYGYKPERSTDGKGWRLVVDPDSEARVREIVDRILGGDSMNSICIDFNDRGVPTPSDHYRKQMGKDLLSRRWKTTALIPILRSRTLLGIAEQAGEVIRDAEGMPVKRAEPILTQKEWDRVQVALDAQSRRKTRTAQTSPLLGIVFCHLCGLPMYRVLVGSVARKNRYQYYRCRGKAERLNDCTALSVRADKLMVLVEEMLLAAVGDLEIMESVLIPAKSHHEELRQAEESLADLLRKSAGKPEAIQRIYRAQIESLEHRIVRLSDLPETEERTEFRPTGKTYQEAWREADTEDARRRMLLRAGVRVRAGRADSDGLRAVTLPVWESDNSEFSAVTLAARDGVQAAMFLPRDLAERATGSPSKRIAWRQRSLLPGTLERTL
ncbi:recombinase family protein [Plantactinospora sp. BB1]|uniref:recombinase family protein n=1 Tax=Plantactinospora sp. BB1 TaxID=2071627 RepID=UPI00131F3B36|nr:recombinase family protein [Plantactinospora sp. BB1]